jgi:hypothetical protein
MTDLLIRLQVADLAHHRELTVLTAAITSRQACNNTIDSFDGKITIFGIPPHNHSTSNQDSQQ